MLRLVVIASFFILCGYMPPKPPPFHIYARKIVYNWEKGEIIAQGGAEIVGRGYRIMGDYLIYNVGKREFRSRGKVVLESGGINLEGENLWINLDRDVGYLEKGRYFSKKEGYFGEGERVVKLSSGDIWIEKGSFTTCDPIKPTWKVEGEEVVIKKEGYLLAKGLKVYVKGRKVLSLPYGVIPIREKRRTGFLPPSYGSSSKAGFHFEESFFYAPRDYMDFTFTAGYEGKRGPKGGLEFRYDRGDEGKGTVRALFSSKDARWGLFTRSRYWWRRRSLTLFANAFLVSDNDFPADFSLAPEFRTGRFIENTFSLRTVRKGILLQGNTIYFDRLDGSNKRVFSYLPEVSAEKRLYFMGFSVDSRVLYTRFSRDKGYDGWRLRGYSTASRRYGPLTLRLGGVGGYYDTDGEREGHGSLFAMVKYEDDLGYTFGSEDRPVLVVLTPAVYITYMSPFGRPPEFDGKDGLPKGFYATYGLSGRVSMMGREFMVFRVYQSARLDGDTDEGSYDVTLDFLSEDGLRSFERLTGKRLSEVFSELTLNLAPWIAVYFSGSVDPYQGFFRRAETLFSFSYKSLSMGFSYSYLRDVSEEMGFSAAVSSGPWSLSGFYSYLISAHKGDVKGVTLSFFPGCYVASFSLVTTTRPNETRVNFSLGVKGLGGRIYKIPGF